MKIRIGTRKSRLAMIQTELVRDRILDKFPQTEIELVPISTIGDRILDRSLTSFGGKGVFTKELDEALLAGAIDLAVHSAKDMPMEFQTGLSLGAVLEREDPRDVLVTRCGTPAARLAGGSVIGTSSLRRELQIRRINPQVSVKMLRGNVPTRLDKLRNGEYDGILLAAAGLKRLGFTPPEGLYLEYLDIESFIPAPGQGILAVETRTGELREIMAAIHCEETAAVLLAEREYLTILGAGCNAPCGACCTKDKDRLEMVAMYANDGVHPVYKSGFCGLPAFASEMAAARQLAADLAAQVRCKTVSLVGAGPGDAGLFTLRGLESVRSADVIIYDNLICGSLLNEARLDAELIYAGKRSGHHQLSQEEINAILVAKARVGQYVVRLKGGDPFIFGRGGEEAMALKEHGIPFEVVPGISSCHSVAAYAGIPVTERGVASSFHVITGHERDKGAESLDYATLAKEEGTLVFLMGVKNLPVITERLIAHGKSKDTPAAVIQRGTTAKQKKVVSTLELLAGEAKRLKIRTPAVIIIGDVVSLEAELQWFGGGPLFGTRVLATGTRQMVKALEAELKPLGAEVAAVSLIECRPLQTEEADMALASIDTYQWLVFTSANGVDIFFDTLNRMSVDLRRLARVKFAAVGIRTAEALAEHGFQCDFVPDSFTGADLAKGLIPQLKPADRVLLLRAKDGVTALSDELKQAGVVFADIPLYETWVDERRGEELRRAAREADYIVLGSGSAAKAFSRMAGEDVPPGAKLISIGPTTTDVAEALDLKVNKTAMECTAAGITAVILADVGEEGESWPGRPAAMVETQVRHVEQEEAVYFPLFVDLRGQSVLIVGAGTVASRRAQVLAGFGARIQVVAPEGTAEMEQLWAEEKVSWERRPFAIRDVKDRDMVLAVTSDEQLNGEIVSLCRDEHIPVNNAGDRSQCDFYFPGIARRGDVVVGVTASGRNHRQAGEITGRLQAWLSQETE